MVSATDAFGNPITTYTGTVHFASSDGQALLPGDYTFTAADQGTHSFSITLKTAAPESITAADVSSVNLNSTFNVTVAPGSTTGLQMTAFPDTMAGIAHSFTVTAEDAYGNTNVNYAGTISFTSSDVAALLPASYTFVAADGGVHTFIATLKTAGTQGLTAQDGTHNLIVGQSGIVVQAGALSKLTLAPQDRWSLGWSGG